MADHNPHQLLFSNLSLLEKFVPASPEFAKCIKENMFAKPNRTAFDLTLYYLCNAYDPVNYVAKIPWPILDRSQERTFRLNTVAFIKDIIKEVPEARIPNFSPSFISTPGGERLVKFMWKFSMLVLKTVVERESDDPFLQYPTSGLHLMGYLTESTLIEVRKDVDDLCQLIIHSITYSKKLVNDILNHSMELKSLQTELTDLVYRLEHCPLTDEEKKQLLSDDKASYTSVMQIWQDQLNIKASKAKAMLKDIQVNSSSLVRCYESVKLFVDNKTMPTVLDATNYPSTLKDSNGNLQLADVLNQGAKAAKVLSENLSVFGGFQSLEQVLPALSSIKEQLEEVENSLSETKSGYIQLISECCSDSNPPEQNQAEPGSPLVNGGLKLGYEMLQNAQISTPPLVFHAFSNVANRISTDSPPTEELIGKMRPLLRTKATLESFESQSPKNSIGSTVLCTPKGIPVLASRNLTEKVPFHSSIPRRDLKFTRDTPQVGNSSISIPQTPANFCPKNFATSTVCKPVAASSKASPNRSSGSDVGGLGSLKISDISSSSSQSVSSVILSKEGVVKAGLKKGPGNEKERKNASVKTQLESKISKKASIAPMEDPRKNIFHNQDTKIAHNSVSSSKKFDPPSTSATEKKDSSNVISVLKNSPIHEENCWVLNGSDQSHVKQNVKPGVTTPKSMLNSKAVLDSTFDSPLSSSLGVFSPCSANNSFFSIDHVNNSGLLVPESDFEDYISPSGRVSLCPTDFPEPVVKDTPLEEKASPKKKKVPESSRRKSLQDLIARYRQMTASTVPIPIPSSPVPELPLEDADTEIDLDFDLNLDLPHE